MNELYSALGFQGHPFARFSAEEENEYLNKIYVTPRYYPTIVSDICAGTSRFIFGARGIGKSALLYTLISDLEKKNVLPIFIDDYGEIPVQNNERELLVLTLKKLTTYLGVLLLKNKELLRKLNKEDKEILGIAIQTFFVTLSKRQFEDLYDKTAHVKATNILKRIFNWFLLRPINTIISSGSEVVSTTIAQSLGLNFSPSPVVYREYIPEMKEYTLNSKVDLSEFDVSSIKRLLADLCNIIRKMGFSNVAIIFDKIDENVRLGMQLNNVTGFVGDIMRDTALLLNNSYSFVFSIISACRSPLRNAGVRYDKLKPIDITWSDDELMRIINYRLAHFSNGKVTSLWNIVSEKHKQDILSLASQSPRQLLILLSKVYDEQAGMDCTATAICDDAVKQGLLSYAKDFDFVTYYVGSNAKSISRCVKELLQVNKVEFGSKDLVAEFKISTQAANQKIQLMLSYDLIEDITVGSHTKTYEVKDSRIKYRICLNSSTKDMHT